MTDLTFLSQIRDTEQQAADLISQATDEAKSMQDNARQQAAEMIRQARDASATAQQTVAVQTETEADCIIREAREQAAAAAQARTNSSSDLMEQAARKVAERIVIDHAHR